MKKSIFFALSLLLISCGDHSNEDNGTPLNKGEQSKHEKNTVINKEKHQTFNETIDTLSEELKSFIPFGYSAINVSSGDANLDGLIDKILVLRNNTEETTSNYNEDNPNKRIFILLLGQPDTLFKLAVRNDNAVYCIDCAGNHGDPFLRTTIKNGYFSIEHGISGGQHWEQVTTFKFDKGKKNWFLYKDHIISYKLNESEDENAEALIKDSDVLKSVKNFGVVPFEKYDIYKEE